MADINYRVENFAFLDEHEKHFFWFEARRKLILHCLNMYFPKFNSLLEIGCGTGFMLSGIVKAYPLADLYGSDVFIDDLKYAAAKFERLTGPKPRLMRLDARNIPYKNEFDVIVACDVLEHISEDVLAMKNFYAAVKPGGGLIITVPQHRRLWSAADEAAGHVRRYEAVELRDKIEAAGWHVVYSGSFVSLLLPVLGLSRLMAKDKNPQEKELAVSPGVNRLLYGIMVTEFFLIKLGVKFPCGGSRLLVAKK